MQPDMSLSIITYPELVDDDRSCDFTKAATVLERLGDLCGVSCGVANVDTALFIHFGLGGKSLELDTLDPALENFGDIGELATDARDGSIKSWKSCDFTRAALALQYIGDLGEDGCNVLMYSCTSCDFTRAALALQYIGDLGEDGCNMLVFMHFLDIPRIAVP